jgi:hypothetical protein
MAPGLAQLRTRPSRARSRRALVAVAALFAATSHATAASAQSAAAQPPEIEIGGPEPVETPRNTEASTTSQAASHSTVSIHLEGPAGVRLEQDLDSAHHTDWETICEAPCDAQVDSAFDYRVAGGLTKASKEFSLRAPDGGHEDLRVHSASKLWFVTGWVVLGAGAGTAAFAVSFIVGSGLLSVRGRSDLLVG